MPERVTRRSAVLCRTETTYGTAETGFTATDAILLTRPPEFMIEPDNVQRDLALPWLGHSEELPATRRAKLKFQVEMVPSGAAGTPPAWGKLLRACGFGETIVASTRVEYAPVNTGMDGLTFRFYRDGVRYLARGGRGMAKMSLLAYAIPTLDFEFWAFDTQALADGVPSIDLSAFLRPDVVTDANSGAVILGAAMSGAGSITGGTRYDSKGISIDTGNTLSHRKLLGATAGSGERIAITGRAVSGQMTLDLSAADEITWRSDVNANTLTTVAFTHGGGAGRTLKVFGPRVQRTSPQAIDDDGNILIQSDLRFLPGVAGQPELRIVLE